MFKTGYFHYNKYCKEVVFLLELSQTLRLLENSAGWLASFTICFIIA